MHAEANLLFCPSIPMSEYDRKKNSGDDPRHGRFCEFCHVNAFYS